MSAGAWDTFVGRAAELDVLGAALTRAEAGEDAVVLVGGEPGIGKSSLIDRFAADARKRGATVAWGRCWEAGGAPAYWPWVQAIRTVMRERDPDGVRGVGGSDAGELAQIVPELRDPERDQPKASTSDPDTARFRLFDAVASVLRAAPAGNATLLIALDDVHAADTPSLLLLQFLCRDLRDAHIVFVVCYRSTEVTLDHPLAVTLADLTRIPGTRRINLEGLTRAEISQYIEHVTGGDVESAVIDTLEARTDGNPLFVSELVRLMIADPLTRQAHARLPDEIPEGVQEAIARRAAALSPSCRATLETAAVLGRDFPLDVLQELAALDPTELLEVLDEAVTAGMVQPLSRATGDFQFAHLLVRDALYDRLPAAARARAHLRAAEIIEHLRADELEPHLSEIAHHYIAAGPVADGATAANHAARAGEAAVRRLAYEEAVRLLQAAVELAQRAHAPDDTRLDLLLELGDAQARAGDLAGAQASFRSAAVLARIRERPDALATAALGYGGRFAWCRAGTDRELIGLLEDALVAIGVDDSVPRVLLLSRLAGARRSEPDPTRRRTEAKDALEMARRLGDAQAIASALGGWHGAIWNADTPHERLSLAQEMIECATRADDAEGTIISYCARWVARWELGQFAGAREDVETCIPIAARLQQPAQRWLVTIGQAAIALFVGRFDEVERFALAGRREGQGSLQFDADSASLTHLALLRFEQGRSGELLEDLERAADAYPWYAQLRALLARLCVADGQLDRARAELERIAASDYLAARLAENYATFTYSVLADVVGEISDASLAVPLFERLAPYAHRNAMAPPEACVGWIARPLGVLCTVLGRHDDAAAYFEEALRAHRDMSSLPWLAWTHYDYARLLRDTDARLAEEHLRKATLIAQQLNMTALASRMIEPQGTVGGDQSECVFRREGEYWTIAFGGRSIRLKHSKGLVYLAALLAQPGRDIPAVDLAALADGSVKSDSAGNILDGRARAQYRSRIEALQAEIDEADEWADTERASRAREELDFLVHELAAATGLGGRDRTFGSSGERARQRVKKAIAATLARIDVQHPELGRHLAATIRTGYSCRYDPDPRATTSWRT